MRFALASASLLRHGPRTLLAVLGVAVSAALLLDMVMLSTGLGVSFRALLTRQGFDLRIAPRGTLPFDTEATVDRASEVARQLRGHPAVIAVSPVLGASVHVPRADGSIAATALGVDQAVQGDYELLEGVDVAHDGAIVVNDAFLAATGARLGDTLELATGYDPQLRAVVGSRRLVVTGRARFIYLSADQRAVALRLPVLQAMGGAQRTDRVNLFMVRLAEGADADAVQRWVGQRIPRVTAISTASAIEQVDARLSYFRQLSVILGSVSLIVGFLLVTTLVTVSVNERIGEIAVMRAIGVSRAHIVHQILLESLAISLAGAALGLGLGLVTARWLNAILVTFPGLPEAIDFFVFKPRAAWTALGLLAAVGIAAGIYPSWRGASLPIARTLREEAVG
ncbi:MAG TPA: FtsX-like permease family protein [Gemmatimonadaceae bacterium]|nr:FtsX-like permease family protein [Gemmatimonadaceae bacterium]